MFVPRAYTCFAHITSFFLRLIGQMNTPPFTRAARFGLAARTPHHHLSKRASARILVESSLLFDTVKIFPLVFFNWK